MQKMFKTCLHPGQEKEYPRWHDALRPGMKQTIHEYGGHNYSIFLDRDTFDLTGYLEMESEERWN